MTGVRTDFYGYEPKTQKKVRFRPERDINNRVRVRHFKKPGYERTLMYISWTCTVISAVQDSLLATLPCEASREEIMAAFGLAHLTLTPDLL